MFSTSILALALLLGIASGCRPVEAARQDSCSIVVITVDGLRADHVGAYGAQPSWTPHLDKLAEESMRYAYALAPAPWAAPSYAALWAGRYPSELGFTSLERPLRGEVPTLAEAFVAAGWRTGAVTSHAFTDDSTGLDQGFQSWVELTGDGASDRGVTLAATEQLESFGDKPFLLWVQYAGLRPPFDLPVPQAEYAGEIEPGQSRSELLRLAPSLDGTDIERLTELYDAELARVDEEVGRLLAELRARRSPERLVIVVSAPHGCELFEWGGVGDAATLRDEIVRVPLILQVPSGRSGVIPDPVSLVDLAPTLRACAELEPDAGASGLCILPGHAAPERPIFSETSRVRELRAVLDGDWKLVVDKGRDEQQLFDVFHDPTEVKDAADTQGLMRDQLERHLRAFEARLAE